MKIVKYTIKDANRRYWEIEAVMTDNFHNENKDDQNDMIWEWTIIGENGEKMTGDYYGQYDHPPKIDDIILEWIKEVASIAMNKTTM